MSIEPGGIGVSVAVAVGVSVGVSVAVSVGVAVAVSRASSSVNADVSAAIPHPFFDNRDRTVTGRARDLTRTETLDRIYSRIEDQLRNQYSLGFTPAGKRPGYRKIRVSVKRKGLSVQSRDGYFPAQ